MSQKIYNFNLILTDKSGKTFPRYYYGNYKSYESAEQSAIKQINAEKHFRNYTVTYEIWEEKSNIIAQSGGRGDFYYKELDEIFGHEGKYEIQDSGCEKHPDSISFYIDNGDCNHWFCLECLNSIPKIMGKEK